MFYEQNRTAREAAQTVANTAMTLNPVELVTPVNVDDEKELWIAAANEGEFINPQFKYDREKLTQAVIHGIQLRTASNILFNCCSPITDIDHAIKKILHHRVDDALCTANMAASILLGSNAGGSYAQRIYGTPDKLLVAECLQAAQRTEPAEELPTKYTSDQRAKLKECKYDASGIQQEFLRVVNLHAFKNWSVIISDQATAIDVRNKTSYGHPQVVIPITRKVDGLKLAELIGHELECHLRDSANAEALFAEHLSHAPLAPLIPLLVKSDDELFYEGHAKLSDVAINGNASLPKPYYTLVIDAALRNQSFAEIGEYIYRLRIENGEEKTSAIKGAWTATYRAMRGSFDTLGGYAFTKDYAYWTGYQLASEVQQFAPHYLDYASLTYEEIKLLDDAGFDLKHPRYPAMDLAANP